MGEVSAKASAAGMTGRDLLVNVTLALAIWAVLVGLYFLTR